MIIIKFMHFGHTKKFEKNDAPRNVDGFGGVRNGDRIRVSGDVLFFHTYSKIRYLDTQNFARNKS